MSSSSVRQRKRAALADGRAGAGGPVPAPAPLPPLGANPADAVQPDDVAVAVAESEAEAEEVGVGMKRAFPSLSPSQGFYDVVPAKAPGTSMDRKATSDFFSASKSKYKSRIAKFVRATQQAGTSEVKSTAIALEDSTKLTHLRDKSRFSFKHDGIAAVGQVVDIFTESLMHEALALAWKRNEAAGVDKDAVLEVRDADLEQALEKLGWGPSTE